MYSSKGCVSSKENLSAVAVLRGKKNHIEDKVLETMLAVRRHRHVAGP